jgi:hypothetical protein
LIPQARPIFIGTAAVICGNVVCRALGWVLPRSEGGRNLANNIAAACVHCNGTHHKRKRPPKADAYRDEVRRRVKRGAWHDSWVFQQRYSERPYRLCTSKINFKVH